MTLSEHRKRLVSYVFSRYDKRVQPDNTAHGALNVSIRLAIGHIISVVSVILAREVLWCGLVALQIT